ncbi:Hypothetical predicted protein [Paramuricea clavata]|uniref:Uncharacterized protein n=1 Tax=Paramuricea clavata TaxID=317549 RepID=A0A6S7FCX2_PARCT|nr:Hypothetical predicted protein [Paramuricea clavata]
MAGIKLLSIKRNEEASYFYENNVSTTLDSNRNEVVGVQENHKAPQISKKSRKQDERRSKKEEKQKIKETKQREKEKKKSLKNSRKEVVGSVDTARSSDRARIKTNGDVKSNGGFQVGMDVGEAAENKNEQSLNAHEEDRNENEEDRNENEESKEEHDLTIRLEHEEASNQDEDLSKEHEGVSSEHESSIKIHESTQLEITAHVTSSEEPGVSGETHATSSDRHADLELRSENCVEETITVDSVQTTEEAPKEFSHQPKVNPDIPEPTGGQHLEIEISDVTDLDADASSSDQVIVVQNNLQTSTYPSSPASEGQILVATVQQVESCVDLDGIFAECNAPTNEEDKEEKRKSVRFQEETEEIGHGEVESEDHEHASMNLGGDFSGTTDDDSVERPQTLQPAVDVVNKEEGRKVESCVDLDHVFAPSEQASDIETVPEENHVGVGKVNGSAKVNGKANLSNSGTKTDDLVEIRLDESNEHTNTTRKKKEKRNRSGFRTCCFP